MTNRICLSPIFVTATVFLAASPLLSLAEPGVPNDNSVTIPVKPAPKPKPAPTWVTPAPVVPAASVPAPTTTAAAPATYTVVQGDSFSLVAKKFGCTIKSLKKANGITRNTVKPGQVLKIPSAKSAMPASTTQKQTAAATSNKTSTHTKAYLHAQPVQDFDIPASTFASCPVPDPASAPDKPAPVHSSSAPVMDLTPTSAPVAELVSPDEMSADAAAQVKLAAAAKPAPVPAPTPKPAPSPTMVLAPLVKPAPATASSTPIFTNPSSSKQGGRNSFFTSSSTPSSSPAMSGDWASRFMKEALTLSSQGIEYDESWRPPGEAHAWAMDCSNTSRYLYKVTTGLQLPRTASDQYYYLHLQNKAWDVPQDSTGYADMAFLREKLKPGDLLFWENTYQPERQPPITHVMIFLGTNEKGEWIMVGSQSSRGGMHNRRNGGPDIYVFDPHKPSGGYGTWLGLVRHKGRFCAFGRPLEADPTKLSVASN